MILYNAETPEYLNLIPIIQKMVDSFGTATTPVILHSVWWWIDRMNSNIMKIRCLDCGCYPKECSASESSYDCPNCTLERNCCSCTIHQWVHYLLKVLKFNILFSFMLSKFLSRRRIYFIHILLNLCIHTRCRCFYLIITLIYLY